MVPNHYSELLSNPQPTNPEQEAMSALPLSLVSTIVPAVARHICDRKAAVEAVDLDTLAGHFKLALRSL